MVLRLVGALAINWVPITRQNLKIRFGFNQKVIGLLQEGLILKVILNDGRVAVVTGTWQDKSGKFYKVGEKWLKYSAS